MQDLKLNTKQGPLNPKHLTAIAKVINKAMEEYTRVMALRVDFRLPKNPHVPLNLSQGLVTRFIESLQAQLDAERIRRANEGKPARPCHLRYIGKREFNAGETRMHYHFVLLFNNDAYTFLGKFVDDAGNLASKIAKAWCSALGLEYPAYKALTHFPEKPIYRLVSKEGQKSEAYQQIIYRASYLAKKRTTVKRVGERSFSTSQK